MICTSSSNFSSIVLCVTLYTTSSTLIELYMKCINCKIFSIGTINEDTNCYLNSMAEDTQIALCSFLPYQLGLLLFLSISRILIKKNLYRDLIHLSQTNTMWCNIITDDLVWKIIFRVKFSYFICNNYVVFNFMIFIMLCTIRIDCDLL